MAANPFTIQDAITHRQPGEVALSPDGAQVVFRLGWASKDDLLPRAELWLAQADGSDLRRLTSGEANVSNPAWSPDGRFVAFLSDRETRTLEHEERGALALYVLPMQGGGEAVRLTPRGRAVAAPAWSPDGTQIAVRLTDAPDDDERARRKRRDDVDLYRENEKFSRLALVDVPNPLHGGDDETPAPRVIIDGDWEIWQHRWSPDGAELAVVAANHTTWEEWFAGLRVAVVPAGGGAPDFVGGAGELYRTVGELTWSPDGSQIAFLGQHDPQRDCADALYVVRRADLANPVERFRDPRGSLYSIAWPQADTLLLHRSVSFFIGVWTLPAVAGEPTQLPYGDISEHGTLSGATHLGVGASVSADLQRVAGAWGTATQPNEVWVGDADGSARALSAFNATLAGRDFGRVEFFSWPSDEWTIEGQIVYPVGYEEGKAYPTIAQIHGGPQWAWDDHLQANWHDWAQFFAQHGFVTFLPNPRGGTGRGWEYQLANWGDWMGGDFRDTQRGIDVLIERGIADPERLGMAGWSYGGLTTAWAVTASNRFKAAMVGAGITNRTSFQGTTDLPSWHGSGFAGGFEESTDRYWEASAMRYINQVTTPTLFLHGANDIRVPVTQAWEMYHGLRRLGVPTQIAAYPREGHSVLEREHQRDLMERLLGWFERFLKV